MDTKKLRQKILDLAIHGKLVPQGTNDESASILLERIAQEREGLIKEKRIKRPKTTSRIYRREGHFYESVNGEEATCIDGEIPFEIPDSWEWVRLNLIGEIIGGGTPSTSKPEFWDGGIPWITPADMHKLKGKFVSRDAKDLSALGVEKSSARLLPAASVVFSSRAPIGYVAVTENELYTNQGFKSIAFFIPGCQDFLYYTLQAVTENIKQRASGTTFAEISGTEFGKTLIPFPPLAEQGRICDRLDKLLNTMRS